MTLYEALHQGFPRLISRSPQGEIIAEIRLAEPGELAGQIVLAGQVSRGILNEDMILRQLRKERIPLDHGWEAADEADN